MKSVPTFGSRRTNGWYEPYQTLVATLPSIGTKMAHTGQGYKKPPDALQATPDQPSTQPPARQSATPQATKRHARIHIYRLCPYPATTPAKMRNFQAFINFLHNIASVCC
ncbi:hypothetical protein [Bacteroides heparinolyticus]|uniref:hypothetical protein n=1 Tax=Prevotella heparinolytica TaxID=28113 RepID=UPI00359FEFB2